MLKSVVEFVAYGITAILAAVCIFAWAWKWSGWSWSVLSRQLRRSALAMMAAMAVVATIEAQKRSGNEATGVSLPREDPPVGEAALLPLPATDPLHFSAIAVSTNGTVTLTAAWPEDFLAAGQTLDVLGKENLRDTTWMWLTNGVVEAGATNMSWTIENQSPSNSFYKAVVRDSFTDMDDPDCDGMPNVYELHHGTNPWMPDSSLVPKLTVGTNETYTTISTALAASTPYSVIEIVPGMYSGTGWGGVTLPEHPVLITGSGKRPVIRGDSFATFLFPSNSTEQTLLRNLSIDLGGRGGLRAGFWCGGNLPWSGQTASATFDNIYVRMPDSDAQYYGWIFYRSSTNRAVLSRCAVNAAGARDAVGVFAIDPPSISVENCTFANFPSNASGCRGAALLLKTSIQNYGCVSNEVEVTVSGSVFDDSFTDALPLARFEEGTNFLVRMRDCALPHAFESPHLPDDSSSLWVTNGQTAWSGHALVDSLVADLGLGALPLLENDPSTDTDDDGLSDSEEVYERGTDPFLVDSDNDGVTDGDEKHDGTDPANPHSFTQRLLVTVTNTASTVYAVYTAWGGSERVWEANEQVMFPQGFGDTPYTNASPHGATHVKAFCDLNGNGEYDANADILLMRQIPTGSTAQINFIFGDVDGDGFSDAFERSEGTDPCDGGSYCFNLSLTYTDVYQTTNALTFAASWGTNCVYGPCVVDVRTWSHDFGHLQAGNGEKVFVSVWDDANQNGEWDVGETSNRFEIAVTSHDMIVTNDLPYGNFDHNYNSLPDWWEMMTGLNAVTNGAPYIDADGDGLINLHEFWADCNPLVPDGSNTLLSVMAREVDEGVRGRNPTNSICKFSNYETNGICGIFIPNTNFWAIGIDTTCASMWNNARNDLWGGDCNGWNLAGTLISARHVIYTHHGAIPHGTTLYFMDTSSNVYSRTLIDSRYVSCDIRIGLLNSDLPSTVHPAKLLPPDYGNYIGTAKGLPCVTFDQEEKLTVAELNGLKNFSERTSLSSAQRPHGDMRRAFYEDMISGDSGSPRFLLVDQELVLLCVMWKGGGGSGCFITHFIDEIQASMDSLTSGYHLKFINLNVYQRLLTTRR